MWQIPIVFLNWLRKSVYLAQLHWLSDKCLCYHGYVALAAFKQWMGLEVEVDTKDLYNIGIHLLAAHSVWHSRTLAVCICHFGLASAINIGLRCKWYWWYRGIVFWGFKLNFRIKWALTYNGVTQNVFQGRMLVNKADSNLIPTWPFHGLHSSYRWEWQLIIHNYSYCSWDTGPSILLLCLGCSGFVCFGLGFLRGR